MKLKKLVKHLDFITKIELHTIENEYIDKILWEGNTIDLKVAMRKKAPKDYFEDDEDGHLRNKVSAAHEYRNWILDTDINGEAIGVTHFINKNGVLIYKFIIYIKD